MPSGCFAVADEGSIGVENGCEIPGLEEDRAEGGAVGFVVGGGGSEGTVLGVDEIVAMERDGAWRGKGRRARRVRRQEVQSMAAK